MGQKKITTISVDEDVFWKAKREIPNISEFVESCLKSYLNILDDNNNVMSIQDELNKIKEAQLNIHLLSQVNDNELSFAGFDNEKANNVWSKLWRQYRTYQTFDSQEVNNAVNVLNHSADYIIELLTDLYLELPANEYNKCDDFKEALKKHEVILNK